MLPHEFIAKWSKVTLKESAASQSHFNDLCDLVGHPKPVDVDADGSHFTFEKGASKNTGGDGFADVWKRGFFAWEYKGKHKDLDAAYRQLLQYREALESPPLLVVCDLDRFEVHTNFTNTVTRVYRFATADLAKTEEMAVLRSVFFNPDALKPGQTATGVTEQAAGEFAKLADRLRARGIDPHLAAHFLNQVVFCLFAEDVGLLPKAHFSRIVERTAEKPAEFVRYTRELFDAMAHGGTSLLEDILYFNGSLFTDAQPLELTVEELAILRAAARFDWSAVEPAIFGTLFERSLDPGKRTQIGAHYTHPDDIRAVVEPVLMQPLRREWEEVRRTVLDLAAKRAEATGRTEGRLRQQMETPLLGFLERLSKVQVLDPACGSGNFLYIAMNLLKD
ncbi:MAG: class I SAM-dependent DNA methyltransferase, partial [Chloroflexi bacterium]|nr:class I SAM-dependent DNA methyltransferase [Chloroflexota bacterium]